MKALTIILSIVSFEATLLGWFSCNNLLMYISCAVMVMTYIFGLAYCNMKEAQE